MEVKLDVRKTAAFNAQEHYEKAKKAAEKVAGARKALADTHAKIDGLIEKREVESRRIVERKPERERKWFDKFRWFESSDGFLVVGGRDAVTNEILVKKHTEPSDLVFHANVHGAPFFIVKNPGKREIPQATIAETAEAAASYSSAWKHGLGGCDVYYVKPEQVSKTAESGEYMPKGGFMIRGVKEWVRGVGLKLAVGFVVTDAVTVIGGPVSAVAAKTKHYAVIGTGDLKPKDAALGIKALVLRKTGRDEGLLVKGVPVDDIQRFLPGGSCSVLS
ncbi:MAG: NFACT RNA binding domain-containing protein [Candidatus Altiarchaeota archaeon]|nr:NFACT RNA binding domain-containing protein [Candidatus Altiarchaeota archaeon]